MADGASFSGSGRSGGAEVCQLLGFVATSVDRVGMFQAQFLDASRQIWRWRGGMPTLAIAPFDEDLLGRSVAHVTAPRSESHRNLLPRTPNPTPGWPSAVRESTGKSVGRTGPPGGIRTPDLLIRSHVSLSAISQAQANTALTSQSQCPFRTIRDPDRYQASVRAPLPGAPAVAAGPRLEAAGSEVQGAGIGLTRSGSIMALATPPSPSLAPNLTGRSGVQRSVLGLVRPARG